MLQFFLLGDFDFSVGQTILTLHVNSVPTQDQVLVPETLLKKRKSQEAARAARREEAEKRKQVSLLYVLRHHEGIYWLDDYNNHTATRPRSMLSLC